MSQGQGAGPAGETPGPGPSPTGPPATAAPDEGPGAPPAAAPAGAEGPPAEGGVVRKTGRLFKSAVLKTSELIVKTEEKVAEQWAKATGHAIQHSGGFSWRRSDDGSTEVVRRWTAPLKPVRPRRPRWVWVALLAALLAAAGGVGLWLATRPAPAPDGAEKPEPLF